ncbi:MAG: phosphodiester glycosidase family protein [Ruminococcus sp.]|nr:phosphodiester glycosidase family protein [Ruminococcus sp.]
MKKWVWAVTYSMALTALTAYIALDTFVISDRIDTNATTMNTSMFENIEKKSVLSESDEGQSSGIFQEEDSSKSNVASSRHKHTGGTSIIDTLNDDETKAENNEESTETADQREYDYASDDVAISMSEYYENGTKIYVADIKLSSAEYLKTAFADDTYGRNVTENTSEIAETNDALLAINGDYYGTRETGYVIRNGVVYRDESSGDDILCLFADGSMSVIDSDDYTAYNLVDMGVWQCWDFGPALLEDSSVTVSETEEVGKAMASNPRTAIGYIDDLHYVFVVSDGRTSESEGLSLYQLAQFMRSLGVATAYNLDGGGSSTMYYNGELVNNPTTNGRSIKERGVSDIVYIGY